MQRDTAKNNRLMGTRFEQAFAGELYARGWWVLNVPQARGGQPADILAVKGGVAALLDCKVCSAKGFSLERIEPNQRYAMIAFEERSNGVGGFVFRLPDGAVRVMFSFELFAMENSGRRFISNEDIRREGLKLDDWEVRICA